MSDPLSPRHASGSVTPDQPGAPEPTYAERARTLMSLNRLAMLSTLSKRRTGWPFGSVMPYALDEIGRPLFLISSMAMHTQNLKEDARASLLVNQSDTPDPLGAARVTLMGEVFAAPPADVAAVRKTYLARHENARYWVDYEDFSFYRMEIADIYFVGGFGVMGWVAAEDYLQAEPDPLAEAAPAIIEHMNKDHGDSLLLLARHFAGIEADHAAMTSVDRLGFHVRLKTADRVRGARIAFLVQARNVAETRKIMEQMVRLARDSA
jgi:heme oxygenase (biliverdin-IX-beta and delta-forming)